METVSDARKQEVAREKLVEAEVEEVVLALEREVCESDGSSACTTVTDPYNEDTGCDSENWESHGNILLRRGTFRPLCVQRSSKCGAGED